MWPGTDSQSLPEAKLSWWHLGAPSRSVCRGNRSFGLRKLQGQGCSGENITSMRRPGLQTILLGSNTLSMARSRNAIGMQSVSKLWDANTAFFNGLQEEERLRIINIKEHRTFQPSMAKQLRMIAHRIRRTLPAVTLRRESVTRRYGRRKLPESLLERIQLCMQIQPKLQFRTPASRHWSRRAYSAGGLSA